MAKYCANCGSEVKQNQEVCLECGHRLKGSPNRNVRVEGDTLGWAVLGFFFPLVGLILYLVWKEERPRASLSAGKGALWSVIIQVVLGMFLGTASISFL
jgi:hypothetical protein